MISKKSFFYYLFLQFKEIPLFWSFLTTFFLKHEITISQWNFRSNNKAKSQRPFVGNDHASQLETLSFQFIKSLNTKNKKSALIWLTQICGKLKKKNKSCWNWKSIKLHHEPKVIFPNFRSSPKSMKWKITCLWSTIAKYLSKKQDLIKFNTQHIFLPFFVFCHCSFIKMLANDVNCHLMSDMRIETMRWSKKKAPHRPLIDHVWQAPKTR